MFRGHRLFTFLEFSKTSKIEIDNLEFKKYLFIDRLKCLDMLNRWAPLGYLITKELFKISIELIKLCLYCVRKSNCHIDFYS